MGAVVTPEPRRIAAAILPAVLPNKGAPAQQSKEVGAKAPVSVLAAPVQAEVKVPVRPPVLAINEPTKAVLTGRPAVETALLEPVLATTPAVTALLGILVASCAVRPWTAGPSAAPVEAARRTDAGTVGPVSPPVMRQVFGAAEVGAGPRT